ncbi:hypothetical protein [Tenacibaculum finnmarkense]|uniref:Molecular chaperone DnaJ n=1 Tax=Tenacibaculum finnmarkense genomovar finnmarkense TaxID=1458503 RepID=A0AAP1RGR7_9FLAO|nr:hypothetical protein [Tenacibaculum finnmarkense]MBE7695764.1 hypothetical protein [Tenacibaculum finnmarkense genomovar finnmarkense]MCG8751547.1 hypothetical protein [Tenacibaculum finnmarkense]MCG8770596.1 hypothetical protein [Tenacibaculum finnmarkense]MCG8775632.1 hypothetical protein [Tenacibaculum finnmarkense]MCG8872759.1 hypothetical protein [Tenacibaculum finnmarkense]
MKNKLIKIISVATIFPLVISYIKKRKAKNKIRNKILAEGNDFSKTAKNITNSISKSKSLYKKLIVKVHPDRFFKDDKIIANELSSRITKSKKNYDDLIKLEIEVNKFLDNK